MNSESCGPNPETHTKRFQQLGAKSTTEYSTRRHPAIIAAKSTDILNTSSPRLSIARREPAALTCPRIKQSHSNKQQVVLDFVLSHYMDQGGQELAHRTSPYSSLVTVGQTAPLSC